MKNKLLIVLGFLIISFAVGKTQDYNPFVQNASVTPAPLLPVQYNGTGELAFEVGNSGVDDMSLVTNQEMTLVISLSNGVPNDADPINALGGTAFSWFDWSYNQTTKTYKATQNQLIEGSSNGTITIQYEVTRNTSSSSPANGFNVNLQPPPYTNGPNDTNDDADSEYTFVEAEDYGDAPLSYGEAVHKINIIQTNGSYTQYVYLGDTVDQEPANQASTDGLGDDNADVDDEDGITSFPNFIQGEQVSIPINLASVDNSQGFLRAWIDWNQDGDFLDASEEVLNFHAFNTVSSYNLLVDVPPDAVTGFTFARFRAGSITGNSPSGPDSYGEVEDYEIEIIAGAASLSVIKSEIAAGSAVGDVISYEITVENTGNNSVSDIDLTDDNATILTGTNPIPELAPGEVEIFTAEHVITQDDIDAGFVSNTAVATGNSPGGTDDVIDDSDTGTDSDGNTITDPETLETPNSLDPADTNGDPTDDPTITELSQTPTIELSKVGILNDGGDGVDAGDEIDYDFTVTNTGNTTLYDVELTDADLTSGPTALTNLTDEDSDGSADDLAVGVSATATGTYTLTQADVDAGEYVNTADATGDDPTGTPVTDDDTDTQTLTRTPSIEVVKTGTLNDGGDGVDAGDEIDYEFTVTNTGNTTLYDVVLTDADLTSGPTALSPLTDEDGDGSADDLAVGVSATATGTYTLTQADVDAGEYVNTADATGDDPTGTPVTDEDTDTQTLTRTPSIEVVKTGTLNDGGDGVDAGDEIDYEFTVTNTGNTTLYDVVLTDADLTSGPTALSPLTDEDGDGTADDLAVGAITTATGSYTLTQADVDAGEYVNTADATGDDPTGTPVTDDDTDTQTLTRTPSIEVVKTGTLNDGGDGVDAGDEIDYEFTVTNTGNTTLYDVVLTDADLTSGPTALSPLTDEDGDGTADDLAVGAITTATGSYTLTQADVDAGEYVNTADATGDDPTGTPVTDDDTDTQTINQSAEFTVTKNETSRSFIVGEFINYEIIVTNTGNVTVDNIDVTDDNATILTGNPVGTLAPGTSATLTAQHEVAQADVDAGFVANTAVATGDSPTGTDDVTDVSDTGTDTDGNTITDNELVETSNTLDPADTNGDSTDDPTVTPIDPPDLTPVITASPNVMNGSTDFNIFVEVTELNLVNTEGTITVTVPKDTRWDLAGPYDPGLTDLGGVPLDNSEWSYSDDTNNHIFTSTTTIVAGDFSTFGFKASWDAGATRGVYTITSQIEEGSGGENRIDNNVDAEKIDYFID